MDPRPPPRPASHERRPRPLPPEASWGPGARGTPRPPPALERRGGLQARCAGPLARAWAGRARTRSWSRAPALRCVAGPAPAGLMWRHHVAGTNSLQPRPASAACPAMRKLKPCPPVASRGPLCAERPLTCAQPLLSWRAKNAPQASAAATLDQLRSGRTRPAEMPLTKQTACATSNRARAALSWLQRIRRDRVRVAWVRGAPRRCTFRGGRRAAEPRLCRWHAHTPPQARCHCATHAAASGPCLRRALTGWCAGAGCPPPRLSSARRSRRRRSAAG